MPVLSPHPCRTTRGPASEPNGPTICGSMPGTALYRCGVNPPQPLHQPQHQHQHLRLPLVGGSRRAVLHQVPPASSLQLPRRRRRAGGVHRCWHWSVRLGNRRRDQQRPPSLAWQPLLLAARCCGSRWAHRLAGEAPHQRLVTISTGLGARVPATVTQHRLCLQRREEVVAAVVCSPRRNSGSPSA